MALSQERKKFIAALANDEWVSGNTDHEELERQEAIWEKNLENFLNTTKDPEELHEFVSRYNWDKGFDSLVPIIQNPNLDRNTARLAFWLTAPYFHQENYSNRQEAVADHNEEDWDFLHKIIENFMSGFYSKEDMPPDYKNEILEPNRDPKWEIPSALFGDT